MEVWHPIVILNKNKLINYRRHAFSDLRPYVCIVEDCKANSIQFASRSEFAAHLTEHQLYQTWRCTKCGASSQSFDFIQDHIARSHLPSTSAEQDSQIEKRSHSRDLSTQRCPFCNDIPGQQNFVGHICHHLEEISLSAIPREEEGYDEDDGEAMSWEGSSPGEVDKREMGTAAVEEIPEESEPKFVTGPVRDEGSWGNSWGGTWGASTSKKDKKKLAVGTIVDPSHDGGFKNVEETEPTSEPVPDLEKATKGAFPFWFTSASKKNKKDKKDKAKKAEPESIHKDISREPSHPGSSSKGGRGVAQWACCNCGESGMTVRLISCTCGHYRCETCYVHSSRK